MNKGVIKITIDVRTITPLFIAGADQRRIKNEGLRAPSLKGLLRWWFRAIMGGMVASIDHLRELENQIFGSTDQKSRIRIVSTVMSDPSSIEIPKSLEYLWFSIKLQGRQQYYPPNTKFRIDIVSLDKESLKVVLGCLWAVVYLGGIGNRMRRGAGSLTVDNIKIRVNTEEYTPYDFIPYKFVFNGKSINDAKNFIENNLVEIFNVFRKFASKYSNYSSNTPAHDFAILTKKYAKISLINKVFNSWEEALAEMSRIYKQFRQKKNLEERYIFGLPIVTHPLFKKKRQASPLLIGVMDLNGRYVIRIVKFYTSICKSKDFLSQLKLSREDLLKSLQENLDDLDNEINNKLGEIEIDIPEV